MNQRTKFLLIAMSVVAVFWLGDLGYRNLIEGPAAVRERELNRVEKSLNDTKQTIANSAGAIDQLEMLERISLPYDSELARAAYQDWILDLVQQAKLTNASVDASQPSSVKIKDRDTRKPKEIFLRYTFSLRARGSLQQVSRFLFDFYQGGHLHKINSIAFNPIGGGSEIDFGATIEAIGLSRCQRKGELSSESFQRLRSSTFPDYQMIARRNLFARHGDSTLSKVVLSGITINDGMVNAWFKDHQGKTKRLARGEEMEIAAHHLELIDIIGEQVLVMIDGRPATLGTGQSLQEGSGSTGP